MKKLLFLVVFLLLAACAAPQASQPASPQPQATAVSATLTPAFTATAQPTATPTATQTPAPTETPTTQPTPTVDPESRRYTDETSSFSLVPPADWTHQYFRLPDTQIDTDGWYPATADPAKINMGVLLVTKGFDIRQIKNDWAANLQNSTPDYAEVREDTLQTNGGLTYLRWEITYTLQNQPQRLVYSFYSSQQMSLIVIYQRPPDEGSEYDLAVDESFKTVKLLR